MEPQFQSGQQNKVEAFGRKHRTGLVTLLFTDMVGSTALKQQLGDRAAADLFRKHHDLIRETLRQFPQGEEIETAGDSFLLIFATPSDAVEFSLLVTARLRSLRQEGEASALDRIGIHVGEVVIGNEAESRKPKDLFGIQIDTCSRVMSLAKAGQTLMTRAVFDSARQVLKGEDIQGVGSLEWLNHGPYLLKGLEEPVEICEVREAGQATGGPPTSSEKAQRQVRADEEPVLGWRPAVGQAIPNTRWVLEKKLGEGGFGEVWLGRNNTTKERRVFKFCFQSERVRFLKRELTLFRVLKERAGDHPHIVAIRDVNLDQPPFYVEMDYVEGADLRSWCEEHGGTDAVSLETRLEIVAQAADGLQAAHEAGIIHRDIKPANILVNGKGTGPAEVRVKLTDFGIGQVVSEEYLKGITRGGFTQTIMADSSSSRTGTQLYMAPELLGGKPASIRSDIYSLGVVLYQLLVGDLARPVTTDWANDTGDPLLENDLRHCFAGNPQDRFISAGQLAKNLRTLPERRKEQAVLERAAYRRGVIRTAGAALLIVIMITGLALVALQQSRQAKAAAQAERHQRQRAEASDRESRHLLYVANMNLAQQAWEQNNVGRVRQLLKDTAAYPGREFEWYYWQRQTHLAMKTLRGHHNRVIAVAISPDGQRIVTGSDDNTAKIWEMESGQELFTLKGHRAAIRDVAFSPDSQRIITGSEDHIATVWDAMTGKKLFDLKGHSDWITSVGFFLDGQRLITGSRDKTVRVWDAITQGELRSVKATSLTLSPGGQRVMLESEDHTAKVWDMVSEKDLLTLKIPSEGITSMAFSPSGQRIVTGNANGTSKVWDAVSGTDLVTLSRHASIVNCTAFSLDGQRIVTGGLDQTAKVWETATGRELVTLKGHAGRIRSVAFSPDGHRIVTASEDQTAKIWDIDRSDGFIPLIGHSGAIRSVAFSPDGHRIVTASEDHTAKVWEASTGKALVTLVGQTNGAASVVFSPEGQRVATVSGGKAKVWEIATGGEFLTLERQKAAILCVAFSQNGQKIITGNEDGTITEWEARTGKTLFTFQAHREGVSSLAISSNGQRIATGSWWNPTPKVWDAANGRELLTLKGHDDGISSLTFSSDGRLIVTCCNDTAKVWDAETGKELRTLKGHSDLIFSASISLDGRRAVTASLDYTARVWEVASGKEMLTLRGNDIVCAAFSQDGRRIVTGGGGSFDNAARVWQAATDQQVARWVEEEKGSEDRIAVP